jgi:hypothetical protein
MGIVTVYLDKISNLQDEGFRASLIRTWFPSRTGQLCLRQGATARKSLPKKTISTPSMEKRLNFQSSTLKNLVLHVRVLDDDFGFDDLLGSCNIESRLKEGNPWRLRR